jgi:hypothetical protein
MFFVHEVLLSAANTANNPPPWWSLMPTAFGLLSAIVGGVVGVIITQRRTDRRERQASDREADRERRSWHREDSLRTFENRRDAYADFFVSLEIMASMADEFAGAGHEKELLHSKYQAEAFEKLRRLELYASSKVSEAANAAYMACWNLATLNSRTLARAAYDSQSENLLREIRTDLNVPNDSAAAHGWSPDRYVKPDDKVARHERKS